MFVLRFIPNHFQSSKDVQIIAMLKLGTSTLLRHLVLLWALPTPHAISGCQLEVGITSPILQSRIAQIII